MRFIHAADLHLDTAFVARSEAVRKRLREASRDALRRLVDLALREGVDAVVLAGDLFDGSRLSFQTERLLVAELGRLAEAGVTVVYATGNHDPGQTASRASALRWPSNVHVARGPDPVRVEILRKDGGSVGSITAIGHSHAEVEDDLVPLYPKPQGTGAHVAVLHATVLGSPQAATHARYAPTDLGSLKANDYHYWALGHIHLREALSASPGVHYPGNTQGRSIRECGPKGCLLVDLGEPHAPRVTFHRLGTIQWEHLKLDKLEACHSVDGLIHAAREAWDPVVAGNAEDPPSEWVVRVTLSGPSPLYRDLADHDATDALARELRDALGVMEVEVSAKRVFPPVRIEDHLDRKDVLGEALRLVGSTRAGGWAVPEGEVLLGLEGGADPDDYVADLLQDAEAELLARMLKPDSSRK
jgi:DNA repair protein SbcD/Mre11